MMIQAITPTNIQHVSFCSKPKRLTSDAPKAQQLTCGLEALACANRAFVVSNEDRELQNAKNALYDKIQAQLARIKEKDIKEIAETMKRADISEKEALYTLQFLTQYGNIQSLAPLADKLNKEKIVSFVQNDVTSTGSVLDYIYNSKHLFRLNGCFEGYILDEAGLSYLENNPDELEKLKKSSYVKFISLIGFDEGINFLNQGKDLSVYTKAAVKCAKRARKIQAKTGCSFEEALFCAISEKTEKRAKKLGIKYTTIQNKIPKNPTHKTIADNLCPMNISKETLSGVIDAIAQELFDEPLRSKAKKIITDYFNSQIQVYSPMRLGEELRKIHKSVIDFASTLEKSDGTPFGQDDIVYIIPSKVKSYNYIGYQYALLNDIPKDKFRFMDWSDILKEDGEKLYVALDDILASGYSLMMNTLKYPSLARSMPAGCHIAIAPVAGCLEGKFMANNLIQSTKREGKDKLILISEESKPYKASEFYLDLNDEEKEIFEKIFYTAENNADLRHPSGTGFAKSGYAVMFPYMAPDNDSVLSSFVFEYLLPSKKAIKSCYNPCSSLALSVKNKIIQSESA